MDKRFGIVTADRVFMRADVEDASGANRSDIVDEVLSGWALRIGENPDNKEYVKAETFYGYEGYIPQSTFRYIDEEELKERQDKERFFRIVFFEADILDDTVVQGYPLETLLKNSIVELLEWETVPGWSRIRSAKGNTGFVHTQNLAPRADDDGYFLEKPEDGKTYFMKMKERLKTDEEKFRNGVKKSALAYLNTQYRWGGKSSQGIDCSALAFMSYFENGLLIYRDAQIVEGYPIRPIDRKDLKTGDLIFFPNHVAIYIGNNKFIHATGYAKTPCVTINSLWKEDSDYREDLDKAITECGSIFV